MTFMEARPQGSLQAADDAAGKKPGPEETKAAVAQKKHDIEEQLADQIFNKIAFGSTTQPETYDPLMLAQVIAKSQAAAIPGKYNILIYAVNTVE